MKQSQSRLLSLPAPGSNDRGVHPDRVQTPKKSSVLDFHATIHHHFEPGCARAFGGFLVNDAQLHPDDFSADGDRVFDNPRNRGRIAKISTISTGPGISRSEG